MDHLRQDLSSESLKVIALVPAYNEGGRIEGVVKATLAQVDQVLVVDDGSRDDTAEHAKAAGAVVIRHPHNLGKGAACRSGFLAALQLGCDAIVTLDGDGQHDPRDIPHLIAQWEQAPAMGIVVGNRMNNTAEMPLSRFLTNRLLSMLISWLAGQRVTDTQCGYRLIHRKVLEAVDYENNRFDAESEILVRAARRGFRLGEVPVRTIYGNEFSKINVFWDTLRFLRFFFRHLFGSPPVAPSREKRIALELARNLGEGS